MSQWSGRRATADLDKRNPVMVIFLRRPTIRDQPKKGGDKSERLLTEKGYSPYRPKAAIVALEKRTLRND